MVTAAPRWFLVLFATGLVVPAALRAQAPVAQEPQPPIPIDAEADRRGAPVRLLSLEDVLQLGRLHNASLRAAEVVPQQARLDQIFAEAGFEPELYGSVGYRDAETPGRNLFQPSLSSQTLDATVGWRQRVVTGGLFDLAFRPARFDSSGSQAFPDRQFSSEWVASFRQPLLRSAWTDYNLAPVATARYQQAQADHRFDRTVQDTLLRIVQAYWELVFARENWRVVDSALAVAREQLRITEERIRVRELAPRDRVADESEVARRLEQRIVAENAIRAREDELRQLLFDGADPQLWNFNLRPTSAIAVTPQADELPYVPLVEVALLQRPDLRALRSAVAAAEVAQLEAERDVLPNLDLIGSYSSAGVSTTDPLVPGSQASFASAFGDSVDQQYPDWSLRLEFSIPIGNHAARARRQRAGLEVERQRRELHAATLQVTREVRDAVRNLSALAQSIAASAESVRLAATNLETERIKLRVGASTAFEVQRRLQELSEAQSRHLRNQLDYRVAESALLHVQGLLQPPR
ncbi:MAG: TolC family protein [Planctomycetes bacterium]|nr:TolC family protein [Planctomycetota bacterium]